MKKFFAVMLSIMLLVTALVPMSVSAASTASEAIFDPEVTFQYTVKFKRTTATDILDDAYVYEWTPQYDGVLKLYDDSDNGNVRVVVRKSGTTKNLAVFDYTGKYKDEYEVSCTVKGGTKYNIYIMTSTGKSASTSFFAGYNPQTADGIMGAGVKDNPYILESTATPLPKIKAGQKVYFAIEELDDTLRYDLTIKGASTDKFTVYAGLMEISEVSSKGSATVEAVAPTGNDVLIFSIENTGTSTGGPYTFSYAETEVSTLGNSDNPDTLKVNTTLTAKITGFAYYYTYTATEDGTLVFAMPEDNQWKMSIMGNEMLFCDPSSEEEGVEVGNPVFYQTVKGEEISIWVANADYVAGKLTFDVTFLLPGETLPTEPPTTEPTEPPTSEPEQTDPTEPPTSEPEQTDPTEPPTSEPVGTDPTEPPTSEPVGTDPTVPPTSEPVGTDPTKAPTSEPEDTDPTKAPTSEPEDTDPTVPGSTPDEGLLGDVNGDGVVNVKDATAIQKHIAGLITLSGKELILADYNLDKAVNIKDATTIQKKIAGLI